MIRGAQKRMIVVRTHDSRVFEEAYFVMRPEREATSDKTDMLSEANRIIRRSTSPYPDASSAILPPKHRPRLRSVIWFIVGLLSGSGGILLLQWWL